MGRLGLGQRETRRRVFLFSFVQSLFRAMTMLAGIFQRDGRLRFQEETEMHRKPDHQHELAFYIGLNAALGCLIVASVLLAAAA
jgi:hypothetical protein